MCLSNSNALITDSDVDEGSVAAVMSSDVDIGLKVKKSKATQSRNKTWLASHVARIDLSTPLCLGSVSTALAVQTCSAVQYARSKRDH